LLDDNRLVLDIARADCALDAVYEMDDPMIGNVRAEGAQLFGTPGTRVVLELGAGVRYSGYLTPDRTGIVVRFQVNEIIRVGFRALEDGDIITVEGENAPALTVSPAENDEIHIDLPAAKLKEQSKWVTGEQFKFVKSVATTQIDPKTARITLKVTGNLGIAVSYEGNVATVKLSLAGGAGEPDEQDPDEEPDKQEPDEPEPDDTIIDTDPGYDGSDPSQRDRYIFYDTENKTLAIKKRKGYSMGAENVQLFDDYSNLAGVLTLPGVFIGWIGNGAIAVDDEFLKNITIGNNGAGQTQISIHEKLILAFRVYDDSSWLYVKIQHPRDAYDRIVVIDPGHGGPNDPGASANGLVEKDLNLDVSKRVIEILERDGRVKAYATRTVDKAVDLHERPKWGTEHGDLFVSIHMNAMSNNSSTTGTEVFWRVHDNDKELGFSGKDMADIFQRTLLRELGTVDRKVQTKKFVVVRYTKIPSVLCEIGFITNKGEAAKIATPEYRQRAAQALCDAIYETFSVYTPAR
jgi:N-acetylmuramoyl-L-alanine amidase